MSIYNRQHNSWRKVWPQDRHLTKEWYQSITHVYWGPPCLILRWLLLRWRVIAHENVLLSTFIRVRQRERNIPINDVSESTSLSHNSLVINDTFRTMVSRRKSNFLRMLSIGLKWRCRNDSSKHGGVFLSMLTKIYLEWPHRWDTILSSVIGP